MCITDGEKKNEEFENLNAIQSNRVREEDWSSEMSGISIWGIIQKTIGTICEEKKMNLLTPEEYQTAGARRKSFCNGGVWELGIKSSEKKSKRERRGSLTETAPACRRSSLVHRYSCIAVASSWVEHHCPGSLKLFAIEIILFWGKFLANSSQRRKSISSMLSFSLQMVQAHIRSSRSLQVTDQMQSRPLGESTRGPSSGDTVKFIDQGDIGEYTREGC